MTKSAWISEGMTGELDRISRIVGKEGKIKQRAAAGGFGGSWAGMTDSVNALINDQLRRLCGPRRQRPMCRSEGSRPTPCRAIVCAASSRGWTIIFRSRSMLAI
jgi:hypothetical protein